MFSNKLKAQFFSGEREYVFFCDQGSPLGEIRAACYQILGYCDKIEREHLESTEEKIEENEEEHAQKTE